jgi:diaminopimelate epimerase
LLREIPFCKYHGLGNDFIVSAAEPIKSGSDRTASPSGSRRLTQAAGLSGLARAICDRHIGVGADGFLVVSRPSKPEAEAAARFFNSDGSEAEMSGNGIRCIAAYLLETGAKARILRVETAAGLRRIEVVRRIPGGSVFRVEMGAPIVQPEQIPFVGKGAPTPVTGYPLKTSYGGFRVTVTSMGNPHCTLFVESFDRVPWQSIGREIEAHRFFPNRTNVEFVRVQSRVEIEVRFWERGVGQTASSGTGSCGAVVASILNKRTQRRVRVQTLAGVLEVSYPKGGQVLLTGPAVRVASGVFHFLAPSGR